MPFTAYQYDEAIKNLQAGKTQLEHDGNECAICGDSGHAAGECGFNPLVAIAMCHDIAEHSNQLHDTLHRLCGYDQAFGVQIGPARIVVPPVSPADDPNVAAERKADPAEPRTVEKKVRDLKVGDRIYSKITHGRAFEVTKITVGLNGPYLTLKDPDGNKVEHDTSFDSRNAQYRVEVPTPVQKPATIKKKAVELVVGDVIVSQSNPERLFEIASISPDAKGAYLALKDVCELPDGAFQVTSGSKQDIVRATSSATYTVLVKPESGKEDTRD